MSTPFNSLNGNHFATITNKSSFGPTATTNSSCSNGTGQLSLNQRGNQVVKKTFVTPEGARIEETITIYPPPYHSQEIVRKVVRTGDFLSPTSTGDRNGGILQRESAMSCPITRLVRHSGSQFSGQSCVHNSFQFQNLMDISNHSQSPILNTQPNFSIDESVDATQSRENLNPMPLTAVFVSLQVDNPTALQKQNLVRNHGAKRKRSRAKDAKRKRNQDYGQLIIYDDENGTKYDGKTHSLPHKKNGPYGCPKCNGSFPTSQSFAAHMNSHYKHESREERTRRLMAKLSKKYLQFQQLGNAIPITIVPNSLSNKNGNFEMSAQPRMGPIVMDEAGSNIKDADNAVPSADAAINKDVDGCFQAAPLKGVVIGNGLSDVKVKEESVELEPYDA